MIRKEGVNKCTESRSCQFNSGTKKSPMFWQCKSSHLTGLTQKSHISARGMKLGEERILAFTTLLQMTTVRRITQSVLGTWNRK
jgi:hypothetical protein